ncbi:LLM class F420-dependent oxidoreductase [Patulibacter sp.]|uniref:LLM class F420-dependent oxidoreductase n=1 Tax=Patulibacter sp. TaxID=1912859 RepID=UPI002721A8FE|nr:LLM class F420-dependent oxidoreductase [Patulibacter sp.]MDO9409554.1 LLM class F420-dependent oxidoreductase [Patulibacter sp.]
MSTSTDNAPATQDVDLGRVGLWSGGLGGIELGRLREVAAEIEELGFGTLWWGEAPGARETLTQALVLLGATERLVAATGIANLYMRDAAATVAGARTIAALHPGRFVLGLGVSHAPLVEGMMRKEYGKPLKTMRAYLDAMDAAPKGTPESRQPGPPVLLAALGPKMLELARDRAQGAHPYLVTVEHTQQAREALGPDRTLAVEQGAVLTTDRADGLRRARVHLEMYKGLPNYRNAWLRLGFTEDETQGDLSDRLVDALVVIGDEEAIGARVAEHHAAGADHVCLQVLGEKNGDPALDDVRRLGALTR